MNPFDLPGPEFLLFYLVFAVVVLVLVRVGQRWAEAGTEPPELLTDPYAIACLRGGPAEALRVAALSLIDRGLLVVESDQLKQRDGSAGGLVKQLVERAVFASCAVPRKFASIETSTNKQLVEQLYHDRLTAAELLPGPATITVRWFAFLIGACVLWGVAGYKLVLAAERGRANVGFCGYSRCSSRVGWWPSCGALARPARTARSSRGNSCLPACRGGPVRCRRAPTRSKSCS